MLIKMTFKRQKLNNYHLVSVYGIYKKNNIRLNLTGEKNSFIF